MFAKHTHAVVLKKLDFSLDFFLSDVCVPRSLSLNLLRFICIPRNNVCAHNCSMFFFSNEAVPLNLVTFPVDSIIAVSLFGNMTVDTVDTGNIATGTTDPPKG